MEIRVNIWFRFSHKGENKSENKLKFNVKGGGRRFKHDVPFQWVH
jgi:hypothetical protein